ncbi:uncharacterized protein LOC113303979 [Papaver somniferum]|uniref:uncharacterized protein LOC113303979 n=1 Tax=Papaver somniferum TaxID=3469 RepID=UPI000E6F7D7A|nr:uncharacterized protein LOC113303979 [Papaver somniferum]
MISETLRFSGTSVLIILDKNLSSCFDILEMEVYYKGWKKLKRSAPQITEDNALSVPKSFVTCSRIFCSLGSRIKLPLIIYCHMSGSRSKSRRVRVMLRPRGDAVEAGCDAEVCNCILSKEDFQIL